MKLCTITTQYKISYILKKKLEKFHMVMAKVVFIRHGMSLYHTVHVHVHPHIQSNVLVLCTFSVHVQYYITYNPSVHKSYTPPLGQDVLKYVY